MVRICLVTGSGYLKSVPTDISTTEHFEYDANGNTIYNHNQEGFRKMYWDESNRLRVVNDNDHQIQHYIYDGAGERILKASSQIENVYENGQVDANTTTMGLYTTYVSPYMVVDANQKYSKHYFNGTQRVASKIGEQDITMFDTNNPYLKQANSKAAENTPSTDFDALKNKQITDFSYYLSKSTNNTTAKNVKVNYTEYKKADTNTESTSAKTADNNSAFAAPQYAELYYYHSDHLGTGTFLSDFDGNPYQFFLNLPFGETMAEQHSYSGDYTNRYKFNGKELDEETGFYYYGARYYNPKFSIWLSVDPLAEKMPNVSPYIYCLDNPINMTDPDGRFPLPLITGLIGAAGGLIYGVATGKNWKQTLALTGGGFVAGATLGFGTGLIATAGGVSALGGAGTTYVTLASGITAGFLGNATEQGLKIGLGESDKFSGDELIMNGVFGMSEVVLGPLGNAVENYEKNSIKSSFEGAFNSETKKVQKDLAKQLKANSPFEMTKKESKEAARQLILEAHTQNSTILQGSIQKTQAGIKVAVSAASTTISEETKSNIPNPNPNPNGN